MASPFGAMHGMSLSILCLQLQKRAVRLALDESMSTPVHLFRKLEWIPNLIKMRKILLIVNTWRSYLQVICASCFVSQGHCTMYILAPLLLIL